MCFWQCNNNNNNNNRFTALCPGLPGWAGTRRNTHPSTILIIIQSLSASSIYHDPQHPCCSNYVLGNLFAQPLSMSSLVYLLVWSHSAKHKLETLGKSSRAGSFIFVTGNERADFAPVSALSLPRILTWLGIQHKMILLPLLARWV